MHIVKKLAGLTAVYGLSSIVGRLLNYLLVPLYTRLFLPEEYGVVTELYAYAGFFAVILLFGMETAFFRFGNQKENLKKAFSTAYYCVFSVALCFVLIFASFSGTFADLLYGGQNRDFIIYFVCIICLDAVSAIPFALLRLQNRAIRFASIRLINIGVNISLNLFFLLLLPYLVSEYGLFNAIYVPDMGIGYIFISNLIASFVTVLLLLPDTIRQIGRPEKALLMKMLAYGSPLLFVGLAGVTNELLDRVLMKHLLTGSMEQNMAALGIYGANYKLSLLMTLFIQAYRYAVEPFFFAHAVNRSAKSDFAKLMHYFVYFGGAIFVGVLLGLDLLKYFIGSDYHEGLFIVPILLMANLWLGIYYNLSAWYKLSDKTRLGAYVAIAGAFVTLSLNILLVPALGYAGAAWATLGCYLFISVVSYLLGSKYYPIPYSLRIMMGFIIFAMAVYLVHDFVLVQLLEGVFLWFVRVVLFLGYMIAGFLYLKKNA